MEAGRHRGEGREVQGEGREVEGEGREVQGEGSVLFRYYANFPASVLTVDS